MTIHPYRLATIALAVAAASLAGCGGSDDDGSPPKDTPLSAKAACDALAGTTIGGGEILTTSLVAAMSADAPEHCAVTGRIAGSEINFVAKLPTTWNGKAHMGASGGWQGSLTAGVAPGGTPSPLAQGYVDYITDSGHTGATPPGAAFDSSFSTRPEGLANFAGLSYERTTNAVKAIVRQRYGQDAQKTYFEGCSGGGHVALLMAQRYPRLFDGIIAGAPAPNFVGTFLGWQPTAQALAAPGGLPSAGKLATLSRAVLAQCDRLDGVEDGIVSNPLACSFDPAVLRCTGTDDDGCLTDAQIATVRATTSDIRFNDGTLLVKGRRLVGHEDDANNWPFWMNGTPSLFQIATGSMINVLTRNPNADPLAYSILGDETNILNLSSLIDAWPGDLSEFGAAGGKLIVWNGTSDVAVPFENQIRYYDDAVSSLGGVAKAQSTIKTYFPPGVNHCGAGAGADRFDYLDALDRWVTKGEVPDGKTITRFANGTQTLARPLCAYPTWPKYNGSGDVNAASSFTCTAFP